MLFSVTYEIVTPESAEEGEAAEQGFIARNVSLRTAIDLVGGYVSEANEYPVRSPRWFTAYNYSTDYFTGGEESRSIHLPDSMTDSSRLRLWRLLSTGGF